MWTGQRCLRFGSVSQQRRFVVQQPLLLVLDLDETLVRVCCKGVHHNRNLRVVDFRVPIDVGTLPKATTYDCGVAVRPGLEKFLEWVKERRREGLIEGPWIYTTSTPNYTKALMRHVDPGGKIFAMRVLTRGQCTPCQVPGFFLKDMSIIRSNMDVEDSKQMQRTILVDNNPVSCVLHPSGSVLVRDWLGEAPEDRELQRLQEILEVLLQDKEGNYVGRLAQITRGFRSWSARLKVLGELLAKPPGDADGLRSIFREVSGECNDMKRELLGAAP